MRSKPFCLILALSLLLMPMGCATTGGGIGGLTPPPGCEDSFLYSVPGFLPFGPMIIRAGTAMAMSLKPEIKPVFGMAAKIGYEVVKAGGLAGGLIALTSALEPLKEHGPAISVAVITLDELLRYCGAKTALSECDKEILLSLFVNLGLDAGIDVRTAAPLPAPVLNKALNYPNKITPEEYWRLGG